LRVVTQPAAHLGQLAERDAVAVRHAVDVLADRVVERELALAANCRIAITVKALVRLPIRTWKWVIIGAPVFVSLTPKAFR
jgi:hypothetical protein